MTGAMKPLMLGKYKELAARLLLVTGSSLVALVLAELAIRITDLAPQIQVIEIDDGVFLGTANPDLPYVPNPGRGGFNRHGLRDRTRSLEPSPDIVRVVAVGDSVLFGGATPTDRIFTARLEQELGDLPGPGRRLEVWNLGVPGYDTRNEVEWLGRKGLSLEPRLVIVGYCLNDARRHSTELEKLLAHPDFESQQRLGIAMERHLFLRSHLARLVAWRLDATLGQEEADGAQIPAGSYGRVERALADLAILAGQHRFEVLIVVFPYLYRYSDYPNRSAHEKIAAIAKRQRLRLFDLLPAFTAAFGDNIDEVRKGARDHIHLNVTGHDVAAKATADFIRREMESSLR